MKSLLSAAVALFAVFGAGGFTLVERGEAVCELVRTGEKLVDADLDFFSKAVGRISGTALPVVDRRTPGRRGIVFEVGRADLFHEDRYEAHFAGDEFVVKGTRHSCRWALNRILEEDFGVVFCFPGEHGTHWPRQSELSLPERSFSGDASLKVERNLYHEDSAWERCLGGKEQRIGQFYNHNVWRIFPVEKYGRDPWREKLMPMKNGKRECPPIKDHTWQPCFSAPEAVTEAVKNIREYLDAHPDEKVFSLTVNDNGGYCDCDGCKAANGGTFDVPRRYGPPKTTSRSQTYFRWANAVAAEMKKSHPDVVFGLLAYGATIDPPPFRLEHNLLPFLCASVYQNHNDGMWEKRVALMKAWSDRCDAFGLWDYAYGMNSYAPPRVYNRTVDRYFELKNSVCPAFNAYFGEGSSLPGEGPKRWFYYKKIFNTALDRETALDTWYRACCGEDAAPFLKAYYELWESFWTGEAIRKTKWYGSIERNYCDFNTFGYLNALDEGMIGRADELMREMVAAAKASGDEDQRIRARWLEECHRYYLARITLNRSFLGEEPYDGASDVKLTLEETVAKMANIPAYSRALGEAKDFAERIAKSRGGDSWRYGSSTVNHFAKTATLDSSFESFTLAIMKYAGTPEVRSAAKAVIADERTTERFRSFMQCVLDGPRGDDRFVAEGLSAEEELGSWCRRTWGSTVTPVASAGHGNRYQVTGNGEWSAIMRMPRGLPPGRMMLFSGRFENRSRNEIVVRIHYEAWGDRGTSTRVKVAPGETVAGSIPLESRSLDPKFYLIFNGMQKGDEMLVDGLTLKDME